MAEVPLETEPHHTEQPLDEDGPFWTRSRRHRMAWVLTVVLVVVLLAVVPPLISINRYQRRVASAISGSLGRPVHFDNLALHLLPLPAITIQNFVVDESPDFGAEPVMRANTVEARLRFGSLWRRRIEVSRIALDNPSINLVRRRSDGAWNLQGILMQASHMNSAPTDQAKAGPAPRFPYIEANDARINIKSDNDKLPFAFKEADLALWLPRPNEWRLRLSGKPVRTDTDVSDVGLVRVEATLGRATDLASAPIELNATWKPTPLGEAAKLTAGYDLGWRGEAAAEASLKGTLGKAKLTTDLHLVQLRRADFVPEHTAEVDAHCEATTGGLLRSLIDLRCAIPTNTDTSMFAAIDSLRHLPAASGGNDMPDGSVKPGTILVRGQVPDLMNWSNSDLNLSLEDASPNYALAWLRLFSKRIPRDLSVAGTLSFTASRSPLSLNDPAWNLNLICRCDLPDTTNANPKTTGSAQLTQWVIRLTHTSLEVQPAGSTLAVMVYPSRHSDETPDQTVPVVRLADTITGQVSRSGYTLIYGSLPTATQAASILPPLGDGIPSAAEPDGALEAERPWNGTQTWTTSPAAAARKPPKHRTRR